MNFNERFPAARRAKRRFRGNRKSGSPLAHRVASYQPQASADAAERKRNHPFFVHAEIRRGVRAEFDVLRRNKERIASTPRESGLEVDACREGIFICSVPNK